MKEQKNPQTSARIPALVVSGFLGSGKTSLVAHLLEHAQKLGLRIAIVSNELGELGVDRSLLGAGGEAFVEIEGGCVCCELSDDLIETLEVLHQQVNPDRIVIETSGVALPFDTQLNFWREPVSAWIGDDMAIVVVNAEQVLEGRDLVGTFQDQVSSADLLVLNKIDLVSESDLPGVEARLREIEPEAPLVRAVRGRIEPNLLFPPDALSVDRSQLPPEATPHHHESFTTQIWEVPSGMSEAQIEAELADTSLLRAKGFVETQDGLRLIQLVGRRIEWTSVEVPLDPRQMGRVILIRRSDPELR
ncbi:MAG: GTP-binding protein [Deltaproteobacteria bacterium]|nr:GTP-binding protein [Deltaproteobacteria bacterium]